MPWYCFAILSFCLAYKKKINEKIHQQTFSRLPMTHRQIRMRVEAVAQTDPRLVIRLSCGEVIRGDSLKTPPTTPRFTLSFERHGYWAKETVGFTKKLAYARATALGLEPSSEICRWYGVISCCIQRANAKILRGEPVPGRHATPVPGGMSSLGRDLRLVTG